ADCAANAGKRASPSPAATPPNASPCTNRRRPAPDGARGDCESRNFIACTPCRPAIRRRQNHRCGSAHARLRATRSLERSTGSQAIGGRSNGTEIVAYVRDGNAEESSVETTIDSTSASGNVIAPHTCAQAQDLPSQQGQP